MHAPLLMMMMMMMTIIMMMMWWTCCCKSWRISQSYIQAEVIFWMNTVIRRKWILIWYMKSVKATCEISLCNDKYWILDCWTCNGSKYIV
jgi:hypothetical protein